MELAPASHSGCRDVCDTRNLRTNLMLEDKKQGTWNQGEQGAQCQFSSLLALGAKKTFIDHLLGGRHCF